MWTIINFIFIGLVLYLVWFGIKKYIGRDKPIEEQAVLNPFKSTPKAPSIVRSKYFPDKLYIGKISILDRTIQYLFNNLLFGFPTDPLIVSGFKYFDIDGNPFEEVVFEKIGAKNYIMLIDKTEDFIYFLNRVTSVNIQLNEVPPMASQEEIELTEGDQTYLYKDMSGLIEVNITGATNTKRLIRVYERMLTADESEYLVCIIDNKSVVDYYIGFGITINQLQDS